MPFTKIGKNKYKGPSGKTFTAKQVKLYYSRGGTFKKHKVRIKVDNKLKYYGETDTKTGVIKINVKKHKGNREELADTVKHELYHIKNPEASEKQAYKSTGMKILKAEQTRLLKKIKKK